MRVALDGTPLLGARTGVGQVALGLLTELGARPDVEPIAYGLTVRGRAELRDRVPPGVRAATVTWPARFVRELWARTDTPRIEWCTGAVDVVHALNFVAPPARAPVIAMVHDLTFVRFPELCTRDTLRYDTLLQRALARGAWVHTPSETVADEVRAVYALDAGRVMAIPNGLPAPVPGDPEAGRVLAGTDRYVLALGTIEPRKNLPVLVAAFERIAAADPGVHLVVAGPDGADTDRLTAAIGTARHGSRVRRVGYVHDVPRRDLLAGATVFAYPSVYEGFGLPPLEAMAQGVPVVAADAGALPEVLGDAALLPDPRDPDAIASALELVLTDPDTRARLVVRGRERAAMYSWRTTADRVVDLYRAVA